MCRSPLHVFYVAMFGAILLMATTFSTVQVVYAPSLTISFANVINDQVLTGSYEVVVSASDNSLVSNIKLWVDDVNFIKQENNAPYEFPLNTAAFPDGRHVLKAIATDKSGNTAAATATVTAVFANNNPTPDPGTNPVIVMQDTTSNTGQSIWSGRPVHAEYVTASSVLVGKQIDSITAKLKKNNSPAGTVEVGIANSDLSMKKVFGTKLASSLATSYTNYEFVLSGSPYTIQAGDRIAVKYTGGSSSTNISIMRDTTPADPFDGSNTYHTYYTTSWSNFLSNDLTMTLKLIGSGSSPPPPDTIPPTVSISHSPLNPAPSQPVTFTASASDNAGLSSIEIFVDGSSIGSCAVSGLSANCVKSAGPYTSGTSHTYYAQAMDAAGLTTTTSSSPGSFIVTASPPPGGASLPSAESVFNTETFAVPHHVSHFILVNPTHSHHDTSSSWISSTNGLYLPTNLIISQSTAVTLLAWDDHGIHQLQAKRSDNGATEWTTTALAVKQYSSSHTFSAATKYNTQDVYSAPGYSYDHSHIKGTITTEAPAGTTDGTIVGAMYVPQNFDRTKITGKGLTIESEYNFNKVWKHLPYDNTLIVYSSKQPLSDTLADLQAIVDEVGYD